MDNSTHNRIFKVHAFCNFDLENGTEILVYFKTMGNNYVFVRPKENLTANDYFIFNKEIFNKMYEEEKITVF